MGVGGAVFGHQDDGRMAHPQFLVHFLQEFNGCPVFAAADIALPVQKIADCIHAQTIKVILADPIVTCRLQEGTHLRP